MDERTLQAILDEIIFEPGDETNSSYYQYFNHLCLDVELARILQVGLSEELRTELYAVLCTAAFDGELIAMTMNHIFDTNLPYSSRYKYFQFHDRYHKLILAGDNGGTAIRVVDVTDTTSDDQTKDDNAAAQEFIGTVVLYLSFVDEGLARRFLEALPGLDTPITWCLDPLLLQADLFDARLG